MTLSIFLEVSFFVKRCFLVKDFSYFWYKTSNNFSCFVGFVKNCYVFLIKKCCFFLFFY